MGTLTLQSYWIIRGLDAKGSQWFFRRKRSALAILAADVAGLIGVVIIVSALAFASLCLEPGP